MEGPMDKIAKAAEFLDKVGQGEGGFLQKLMQDHMGADLVRFITNYAQVFSRQVEDMEQAAGSLMILGYLIRAHEEAKGEGEDGQPSIN